MKILIGEDDILLAEHLKGVLLSFEEYRIEMAHSKESIIQKVYDFKPDIALLDIHMDNRYDGIEVGEYIFNNFNFPIIYISSYFDEKTIEKALCTEPSSYILKPFKDIEVKTALRIALNNFSKKKEEKFLMVKEGIKNIKITYSKILFFKSDNNYLEIHSEKGVFSLKKTLNQLLEELNNPLFVRVHQSYAINASFVKEFTLKKINIKGNSIPISRKYKDKLKQFM